VSWPDSFARRVVFERAVDREESQQRAVFEGFESYVAAMGRLARLRVCRL
jgi:hypothetical protein